MEANKTEMKKMKQWLKDEAIRLRELKSEIKAEARAGHIGKAGSLQYDLYLDRLTYRWNHIAYSMAKGKTYEQIESHTKDGNTPNMNWIYDQLENLCEPEPEATA